MPISQHIAHATIGEVIQLSSRLPISVGISFPVQFNPESLKLSYSNSVADGDSSDTGSLQYVGKIKSTLSFDLFFDVTVPQPDGSLPPDVRTLTKRIKYFITPQKPRGGNPANTKPVPPRMLFSWGSFSFDGVVESISESLDFFSSMGLPLRSTMSLSMNRLEQNPHAALGAAGAGISASIGGNAAGVTPQVQANLGESMQQLAGRLGRPNDWKAIAKANNIENPRQLGLGNFIDASATSGNPRASARAQVSIGGQGLSANIGINF